MRARECLPPTAVALRAEDFAARSEAEVRDVSRRLSRWAREAVARLGGLGLLGSGLDRSAEEARLDDAAQALEQPVLTRGDGVTLGMRLGPDGLQLGFELSDPQARAALELARKGAARLRLARALAALPVPFVVGDVSVAPSAARRRPRAMGAALEHALAAGSGWFGVRAGQAEAAAGLGGDAIVDALVVVARVAGMLVPDGGEPDAESPSAHPTGPARAEATPDAPHLVRGARVRVIDGPFSGRVGFVHDVDAKGSARVMLGLLAVKFDVANLAPHADRVRRPVLASSHRKPVPARS